LTNNSEIRRGSLLTDNIKPWDSAYLFERLFRHTVAQAVDPEVPGLDNFGRHDAEYVYSISYLAAHALADHRAELKDVSDPDEVLRICGDLFDAEAAYDMPEYLPHVTALVLAVRDCILEY